MNAMFKPVEWSYRTNIYEVNLRQYTSEGTFKSFAKHLPRLKEMGIEVLWFMPVTPISVKGRQGTLGSYYAASDYTSTNPEFGTLADFKELVKKAHASGFRVIIDWVANHTGLDHHWVKDHPEFYLQNENGEFYDSHGWHDVIDLNYYNGELRRTMISAMQFWVKECNIDGFRCDMAHLVPLDFWREARKECDALKPLFWLAECEVPVYHEVFDASYTWTWMHKTEEFVKGKISLDDLKAVLIDDNRRFSPTALRLWFTSNHDENTWNGTEYEKYGDAAFPLAVFSCTWNGIPLIYSGQEMPNNKRLKFFDKDPLEWSTTISLNEFYKTLLTLKKGNTALTADDGSETIFVNTLSDNQMLAYLRKSGEREVLVLLNFSPRNLEGAINDKSVKGKFTDVFAGSQKDFSKDPSYRLRPWAYAVFEK